MEQKLDKDDSFHRIVVDLDSILDTRLATISQIDPEIAAELFNSEAYYTRASDEFSRITDGRIDDQEFFSRYENRNHETLKLARPTMALDMLISLVAKMRKNAEYSPLVRGFTVEVNTWPYVFDAVGNTMLENHVAAYIGTDVSIRTVHRHPRLYTPALLKEDYSALVMYDFKAWLSIHGAALEFEKIPRVTVMTPAIYHNGVPEDDDVVEINGVKVSPFAWLAYVLVSAIEVVPLDPEVFSILHPERKPQVSEEHLRDEKEPPLVDDN